MLKIRDVEKLSKQYKDKIELTVFPEIKELVQYINMLTKKLEEFDKDYELKLLPVIKKDVVEDFGFIIKYKEKNLDIFCSVRQSFLKVKGCEHFEIHYPPIWDDGFEVEYEVTIESDFNKYKEILEDYITKIILKNEQDIVKQHKYEYQVELLEQEL